MLCRCDCQCDRKDLCSDISHEEIHGSLFNWGFGVGWENNVTVIIELITSIPVMFGIWKLLHLIRRHIFKQVDIPNEMDLLDDYDSIRRD